MPVAFRSMTRWLLLRGLSREKRHREQFPQIREHTILAQTANNPDLDLDALARRWAQYLQSQRPSSAGVVRQIAAAVTFRMPRHIDTPLLILTALRDRIVSSSASHAIATRYGAPIAVHPTAGHDIPLDDGAWIAEQVKQWIG